MSRCLSDTDLQRYHKQELSDKSIERVRTHLEECSDCLRRDQRLVGRLERLIDHACEEPSTTPETLTAGDGSSPGTDPPPDIHIEGYQVLRELGRGGQGVVYQAIQLATQSKVAIKVLLHGAYASDSARSRFEREIAMVAQLRHPGIISIHDSGTTADGRLYYVMDYIRGLPLTDYIREQKLTLQDTLDLFGKICDAVQFAHQRGVIHRDLKPSNVRVDVKGHLKLLDFGLARWAAAPGETLSQAVIGTLPYMSPEQTRGNPDEIDTRSDIYALGVILYELLTGHYPYPATSNMAETIRHIAESPPTPPSRRWTSDSGVTRRSDRRLRPGSCPIDDEVQTVILKALAKEPERRYQSAGDLARDIRSYLAGAPIEAKRDSKLYLLKVSLRRYKGRYATAAVFTLLVFGLCASYLHSMEKDRQNMAIALKKERLDRIIHNGMNSKWVRDYAGAIKRFDEALAEEPANPTVLFEKAQCLRMLYLQNEDYRNPLTLEQAIELCRESGEIEAKPAVWNFLGTLQRQAGEYKESEEHLRKALDIDPAYFYAHSNLAKTYAVQGRLQDALKVVQAGIEQATAAAQDTKFDDGIWLTLATLRLHFGEREALEDLQRAIEIDGEDHRSRMMLARYYLHRDFLEPAMALVEAKNARLLTLNESEDGRILRLLALACLSNNMLDEAERYANEALRHDDEPAYGEAVLAIVAARQDRPPAAQRHLREVTENQPRFQDGGIKVTDDREVLWIDTQEELKALQEQARAALQADE